MICSAGNQQSTRAQVIRYFCDEPRQMIFPAAPPGRPKKVSTSNPLSYSRFGTLLDPVSPYTLTRCCFADVRAKVTAI